MNWAMWNPTANVKTVSFKVVSRDTERPACELGKEPANDTAEDEDGISSQPVLDYSEKNLLECSYGHRTVALRWT